MMMVLDLRPLASRTALVVVPYSLAIVLMVSPAWTVWRVWLGGRVAVRVVLVRLSALGDIVHTWPLACALAETEPRPHLSWVVEESLKPLVDGHPAVDAVFTVRTGRWRKRPVSIITRSEVAAFKTRLRELDPWRAEPVSDAAARDGFGSRVAISGDTIVVGDDMNPGGVVGPYPGAAYIFERNSGGADNWGQVAKIAASDGADSDSFGHAVDIDGVPNGPLARRAPNAKPLLCDSMAVLEPGVTDVP